MTTATTAFRALPERPSIEQLRNQAKDLFHAHRRGDRNACATLHRLRRLAGQSDEQILGAALTLSDVQFALAMDYGLGSWPELKHKVELLRGERTLGTVRREGERVAIDGLPKIGFAISARRSYAGALAAALAVTRQPYTYDQIMAYSGLAWAGPARATSPNYSIVLLSGGFNIELTTNLLVKLQVVWIRSFERDFTHLGIDAAALFGRVVLSF